MSIVIFSELEQHLSDFPIEDPPPYTENHTSKCIHHVTDVDLLKNLDSKSESSDTCVEPERDPALLSLLSQTSMEPKLSAHSSVANDSLGRDRLVFILDTSSMREMVIVYK